MGVCLEHSVDSQSRVRALTIASSIVAFLDAFSSLVSLQPVVRSMLDYTSRFLRLEREVGCLRSDLEGSRVELKGAKSALEESRSELEVVTGELSFDSVSFCYLAFC